MTLLRQAPNMVSFNFEAVRQHGIRLTLNGPSGQVSADEILKEIQSISSDPLGFLVADMPGVVSHMELIQSKLHLEILLSGQAMELVTGLYFVRFATVSAVLD